METVRRDHANEAARCDLVLRDAALLDGTTCDIVVTDGKIAEIAAHAEHEAAQILDLEGKLVLSGFVEAHTHLDKALTATQATNLQGTLGEALRAMDAIQPNFTCASIKERAKRLALRFVAAGTTTLRTHVDVKEGLGLKGVEALVALRSELQPVLDLQIVVLSTPLAGGAGAANLALVRSALALGVDAIGGCPIIDGDCRTHIDIVFRLAEQFGLPIDLHMDESDEPGDFALPYLAERTIALGYQGRVIAGHCCALSAVDDAAAAAAIDLVARAGIAVVTLPSTNMYLQGRGDVGIVRRGLTRVRALLAAGVPVCCGSDNVQDPFNPFGRGDQLLVANLLAHAAHLGSASEQLVVLGSITGEPARALRLHDYGLSPGCWADLVVLDCSDATAILAEIPARRYVLKKGIVVAETRVEQSVTCTRGAYSA